MTEPVAIAVFVACAAVIFVAGGRLSHYGDRIAHLSGWHGAWIGLALMASVTSLPELVVGISSVAWVGSADLAVGDVLGSCAINLLILASLDAFVPDRRRLFGLASKSHVLAAALGIVLLAIVGVGILTREPWTLAPWIGGSSLAFLIIYFVSIRLIFQHFRTERDAGVGGGSAEGPPAGDVEPAARPATLTHVVGRYAFFAGIVVCAALLIPSSAHTIATATGLQDGFVGTVFVALSTSLPELAVSIAAVRMNAIDLAVGNMLGSNLFNVLILAIDEVFYTRGLLLGEASTTHAFTVLSVIAMSAIVVVALTFQQQSKRYLLASDALLILGVYVGNAALLLAMTPA